MLKNQKLSRSISDLGFYEFEDNLSISVKSKEFFCILQIDFSSSKTCSNCKTKKENLSLKERVFECPCGLKLDRDLNAALNLEFEMTKKIRPAGSELKPREMTAMDLWKLSKDLTSIDELGNKHQICY